VHAFSGLFGCWSFAGLVLNNGVPEWSHGVSTTRLLCSLAQQYPHISTLICTACKSSESRQDKQDCQAGPCVSDFSVAGKPSVVFAPYASCSLVCFDVSLNHHPKLKHTVYDSRTMLPKACGNHAPGRSVGFSRWLCTEGRVVCGGKCGARCGCRVDHPMQQQQRIAAGYVGVETALCCKLKIEDTNDSYRHALHSLPNGIVPKAVGEKLLRQNFGPTAPVTVTEPCSLRELGAPGLGLGLCGTFNREVRAPTKCGCLHLICTRTDRQQGSIRRNGLSQVANPTWV
jgi:hypothetical protein